MNRLLGFYYGGFPDHQGWFLAEITRQDDLWLEVSHDYIQWFFPNREMSPINPHAPVITEEIRAAFMGDELLRRHLLGSFARMLAFYGLRRREGRIVKADNWQERKSDWFVHLRICSGGASCETGGGSRSTMKSDATVPWRQVAPRAPPRREEVRRPLIHSYR